MLRHAETVRPSSTNAITPMMISVPRRANERTGLATRAIGMFLLVLLIACCVEIAERFVGCLVNVVLECPQKAQNTRRDGETDLPGHDDQNDRHGQFQQCRT